MGQTYLNKKRKACGQLINDIQQKVISFCVQEQLGSTLPECTDEIQASSSHTSFKYMSIYATNLHLIKSEYYFIASARVPSGGKIYLSRLKGKTININQRAHLVCSDN